MLQVSLLGLFLLVDYSLGSCGMCQSNYVACHSETSFSLCQDGIPTYDVISCPVGRVCTNKAAICVSKVDDSVVASCVTGCGTCDSYEKVFTCLSETTYAFCFGESEPFYTSRRSCSDGYVCDLSSRTVCVRDTISQPSCIVPTDNPLETTTSTTAQAPRDATTFCSEMAISGTFKAEGDTTCTKYYICTISRGSFKGYEYTCIDSYFDRELNLCQRDRPDNC